MGDESRGALTAILAQLPDSVDVAAERLGLSVTYCEMPDGCLYAYSGPYIWVAASDLLVQHVIAWAALAHVISDRLGLSLTRGELYDAAIDALRTRPPRSRSHRYRVKNGR